MRMNESNSISIVVDGDACPVKKEIAETARTFRVPVLLVSSYDHLQRQKKGLRRSRWIGVIKVRIYTSLTTYPGDIVVTQDYGLVDLRLPNHAM